MNVEKFNKKKAQNIRGAVCIVIFEEQDKSLFKIHFFNFFSLIFIIIKIIFCIHKYLQPSYMYMIIIHVWIIYAFVKNLNVEKSTECLWNTKSKILKYFNDDWLTMKNKLTIEW